MSSDASNLLRMLSSAGSVGPVAKARATTAQGAGAGSKEGIDSAEFSDLLARARAGDIASGRPVTIAEDAGISLGETELAALSIAADRAEAAGIRRAAVLIGGQTLIMDVGSREIIGPAEADSGVVSGIDGLIRLEGGHASVEAAPRLQLPHAVNPVINTR